MADKIKYENNKLIVSDNPIIPFIEGDGIGPDIWHAAKKVIDAAVDHSYKGSKKLNGWKFYVEKKHLTKQGNGFHQKH